MSPPVAQQIITSMKIITGEDGTTLGRQRNSAPVDENYGEGEGGGFRGVRTYHKKGPVVTFAPYHQRPQDGGIIQQLTGNARLALGLLPTFTSRALCLVFPPTNCVCLLWKFFFLPPADEIKTVDSRVIAGYAANKLRCVDRLINPLQIRTLPQDTVPYLLRCVAV